MSRQEHGDWDRTGARTATGGVGTSGCNVGAVKRLTSSLNLLASIGRARSDAPANLAYLELQVHF